MLRRANLISFHKSSDNFDLEGNMMEEAFNESISKLRGALNRIDNEDADNEDGQLQKSFSASSLKRKFGMSARKYSANERFSILRKSSKLLEDGSINILMATKIEGRLNKNLDLSDEMKKTLEYDVFHYSRDEEELIITTAERGGIVIPTEERERLKDLALRKALNGKIDSLMLTKIEGRLNRGDPLTVEMVKALDIDIQLDSSMRELLSKAAEQGNEEDDNYDYDNDEEAEEDEEFEDEDAIEQSISREEPLSAIASTSRKTTQSFNDYKGNTVTVTNDELYRKIHQLVKKGKINPLDVTKIESRINRGGKLSEGALREMFLE